MPTIMTGIIRIKANNTAGLKSERIIMNSVIAMEITTNNWRAVVIFNPY